MPLNLTSEVAQDLKLNCALYMPTLRAKHNERFILFKPSPLHMFSAGWVYPKRLKIILSSFLKSSLLKLQKVSLDSCT
jgi:hypothetical protein